MPTGRLLACVAALGLFAGLSCTTQSSESVPADSKAQSANASSAGDEKKVTVSSGGVSVEAKSGDGSKSVTIGGGAVEAKSGDGSKVTIGEGAVEVSKSGKDPGMVEESSGDTVKVKGQNQNLSYECKGRSFSVEGRSNTLKLTGECQNLRVAGTSNQVEVEAVAAINVSGVGNKVTYERGVNSQPPSIKNSGINNSVSKKN